MPRVINVDKNAAYPPAIDALKAEANLAEDTQLRPVKYLNNMVEQDHRRIKRLTSPGLGFGSFHSARRTLQGYEAMAMIRKGCPLVTSIATKKELPKGLQGGDFRDS